MSQTDIVFCPFIPAISDFSPPSFCSCSCCRLKMRGAQPRRRQMRVLLVVLQKVRMMTAIMASSTSARLFKESHTFASPSFFTSTSSHQRHLNLHVDMGGNTSWHGVAQHRPRETKQNTHTHNALWYWQHTAISSLFSWWRLALQSQ